MVPSKQQLKTAILDNKESSTGFLMWISTIGVKIVETLLSFRVDFKLGAKMAPSLAPPGQCCVFLFSTSLVDSAITLIRVGEGGVSRKRTFWTSFLCKQWMFRCQCALLATVWTNFVVDCSYCISCVFQWYAKQKMSYHVFVYNGSEPKM